ncbi:MAG: class I SAM-dependent methyltransferase [Nitrospinae bacterium]|nr:class I SAM-dependent methyltransferase [Nitrospinota bacterium]
MLLEKKIINDFLSVAQKYSDSITINLNEDFFSKLSLYFSLLNRWNNKLNLTRILGSEERILEEFLVTPFLYALKLHDKTGKVLDIGSGNGIPSIFISLINSHNFITLCEKDIKKSIFLKEVVRELSLEKVKVRCCNHDDLILDNTQYDYITMKNVSVKEEFINSASLLLTQNGIMFFQTSQEKINELKKVKFNKGLKLVNYYNIPVHKETYLAELTFVPRGTI